MNLSRMQVAKVISHRKLGYKYVIRIRRKDTFAESHKGPFIIAQNIFPHPCTSIPQTVKLFQLFQAFGYRRVSFLYQYSRIRIRKRNDGSFYSFFISSLSETNSAIEEKEPEEGKKTRRENFSKLEIGRFRFPSSFFAKQRFILQIRSIQKQRVGC